MTKRTMINKKNDGFEDNEDYLQKHKEWLEHQYDPGHYTGGKIHPELISPRNPAAIGWSMVCTSIFCYLVTLFIVARSFDIKQLVPIVMFILVLFGFNTLYFLAGLKFIKKGRAQRKGKINKIALKRQLYWLTAFLFIAGLIYAGYLYNNHTDAVYISAKEQFKLIQKGYKNYVYVESIDKTLELPDRKEFIHLWSYTIEKQNTTVYKLEYQWNSFLPERGEVKNLSVMKLGNWVNP